MPDPIDAPMTDPEAAAPEDLFDEPGAEEREAAAPQERAPLREEDAEGLVDDEPEEDEDSDSSDPEEDEDPEEAEEGASFAELGLPEEILDAVTRMGFETPTPIQAEAIPALLELRDVVGIAQTGTGKTAAFGLPMLAIVDAEERGVQALVLAPTRELAMQSAQAIEDFASRTRGLDVVPVYGGSPYGPQISALKRGAQVVVGTPGRIIDLIDRGALDLSGIRMLVLDEADEMLRMGFAEDVETITSSAPEDRLTALFSATMPAAIERIANTHLTDPVRIAVSEESSTVDTIHQTYAVVPFKHKLGALTRVLATRAQHIAEGQEDADAAIVFVRTRADVEEVSLEMSARGFRAAGISGDVAQTERERMVERLRAGTLDVLVATDVAARGLDVERISLVVNFDVPREPEAYVHRIGRTGRAGREGRSLTFFTPREHGRLRRIERLTGTPMEEVQIPSPAAVSEFRATRLLEGLGERIAKGRLELYRGLLERACEEGDHDLLDIAAALMANAVGDAGPKPRVEKDRRPRRSKDEGELDESGEFLGASFEGRDKDRPLRPGRDSSRRRAPRSLGTAVRYRVEVGKKDRVKPGSIVGAIAGEGGVDGRDIGNIEIFPSFSLVEISADLSDDQLSRIGKGYVQGRPLRIRVDEGPGKGRAERFDRSDRPERDRGEREYARRYEKREGFRENRRDHEGHRGFEDRRRREEPDSGRFEDRRGSRGERGSGRFGDEERGDRFARGSAERRFGRKGRDDRGGRGFRGR